MIGCAPNPVITQDLVTEESRPSNNRHDNQPNLTDVTVILLGGIAMSHRMLRTYSSLYARLGIHHIHPITPSFASMTIPACCDRYAAKLAAQLEDVQGPLVIHVFSGSIWIYYALNALVNAELRQRVIGVIFESTPLDVKAEQFGRFAAWKMRRRYRSAWAVPFIAYRWLIGVSPTWEKRNLERMRQLSPATRVLGIYSRSDPVADWRYIEGYFDSLRQQDIQVHSVALQDSRHCLAIRDHRTVYQVAIGRFLYRLRQETLAESNQY